MALVNDPRVVFLDEPTAGLDPQVRREIYDIIEELKKEKKTILITTHYIEEAEKLCDRVAIVDHGKVIALGTPRELKQRSGAVTRITVRMAKPETNGALGTPRRRDRMPRRGRRLSALFHARAAHDRRPGEASGRAE